jgi:membrane protein implicated in regulation of membrane protease activity
MKPFTTIAIVFLSLIAIMQLTRFVRGWEVLINGVSIPTWASGLAFVVAGGLAAMLWRESRGPGRG